MYYRDYSERFSLKAVFMNLQSDFKFKLMNIEILHLHIIRDFYKRHERH